MQTISYQRIKEVTQRTGLSRSTIYARIASGTFPRPVPLGSPSIVGFVTSEVDQWCAEQLRAARPEFAAA